LESRVKRLITYYPDFEMEEKSRYTLNTSRYPGTTLMEAREDLERGMITRAIRENNWNQTKAAHALGITRQHLSKLMEKYGITKE
jgi:transcriptional regulator with GAF, ATPase, and Fis domain